jgi:hypothetical protein
MAKLTLCFFSLDHIQLHLLGKPLKKLRSQRTTAKMNDENYMVALLFVVLMI